MKQTKHLAALATFFALFAISGCLSQSQFYGTTGEPQQVVRTDSYAKADVQVRSQFLEDYDFWGSRPAGVRFDYFVTNKYPTTQCFTLELHDLGNFPVREVKHKYMVKLAPGAQGHAAYVRMNQDKALIPGYQNNLC